MLTHSDRIGPPDKDGSALITGGALTGAVQRHSDPATDPSEKGRIIGSRLTNRVSQPFKPYWERDGVKERSN